MSGWIDLNADLGEGCGDDAGLMAVISSCNIACGGHAGDAASMREAVRLAKAHDVRIGAHPSYPDREGFGRRVIEVSDSNLKAELTEQIGALAAIAEEEGAGLTHVKPHGALYNQAAADAPLARLMAQIVAEALPGAALVGPPASELEAAASTLGLVFLAEGFADRAYTPEGRLVARSEPGAVLERDEARLAQALEIAREGTVTAINGLAIPLPARTLCLHGDTPGALASAKAIRAALEEAGLQIGVGGDG